jgi:uncharacterized membrane protein YbhN (UPF0104 family)
MKVLGLRTARDWVKTILTLVGVVLFVYLIRRTGLKALEANVARFGPWFLLTCSLGASFFFFQAAAWWVIQKSFFQPMPLARLFRIKVVSSAFNIVLPSASLGGDAMRAFMIKEHVPLKEGIPSVLFDKTIEFVGSLIFLVVGLILGLLSLHLPKALIISVVISLSVTALITILFILAQKAGVTKTLMKLGRFVPGAEGWAAKNAHHLRALDETLSLLYSRSNTKALIPIGLNILSRLAGVVEVMIIMAVLRAPLSFMQALLISTVVTVGNTVFFVLPGQWGVMEGVYIVVLRSMGFPAAIGLSLSIIRRIRTIFFAGLGLALFALEKKNSTSGPGGAP